MPEATIYFHKDDAEELRVFDVLVDTRGEHTFHFERIPQELEFIEVEGVHFRVIHVNHISGGPTELYVDKADDEFHGHTRGWTDWPEEVQDKRRREQ